MILYRAIKKNVLFYCLKIGPNLALKLCYFAVIVHYGQNKARRREKIRPGEGIEATSYVVQTVKIEEKKFLREKNREKKNKKIEKEKNLDV